MGGKGAKQPEERPRRVMGVGDKKEREREKGGEGSDLEDLK